MAGVESSVESRVSLIVVKARAAARAAQARPPRRVFFHPASDPLCRLSRSDLTSTMTLDFKARQILQYTLFNQYEQQQRYAQQKNGTWRQQDIKHPDLSRFLSLHQEAECDRYLQPSRRTKGVPKH
mmetsp:Transcript_5069/g.11054  ORF Transcript_5069/g.11054 Transcript_5069/m.11054 type:complete len:126 (+) Transcript_5069:114-491(+)